MLGTNCGTVALIVVCLLGVNIIHAPLYSMFVLYGKMYVYMCLDLYTLSTFGRL